MHMKNISPQMNYRLIVYLRNGVCFPAEAENGRFKGMIPRRNNSSCRIGK